MKPQDHYTFFLLKPSTLKRRHHLFSTVAKAIKKVLIKAGFQIVKEKVINLSSTDIIRLYREEMKDISQKLDKKSASMVFGAYRKTMRAGPSLLLLAYHPTENAKAWGVSLKGKGIIGVQSPHNTIRYIFRDKKHDDFVFPKGKIVMPPCDNVMHSPRNNAEFYLIIKKYFPKEYVKIESL